jgi:hypothetical protein
LGVGDGDRARGGDGLSRNAAQPERFHGFGRFPRGAELREVLREIIGSTQRR